MCTHKKGTALGEQYGGMARDGKGRVRNLFTSYSEYGNAVVCVAHATKKHSTFFETTIERVDGCDCFYVTFQFRRDSSSVVHKAQHS